jgi:hypothetical protein
MVNTAAVNGAALQKDAEVLRTETAALQEQLTKTLSRFDDVQDQSQSLEGEVVDEVRLCDVLQAICYTGACCTGAWKPPTAAQCVPRQSVIVTSLGLTAASWMHPVRGRLGSLSNPWQVYSL